VNLTQNSVKQNTAKHCKHRTWSSAVRATCTDILSASLTAPLWTKYHIVPTHMVVVVRATPNHIPYCYPINLINGRLVMVRAKRNEIMLVAQGERSLGQVKTPHHPQQGLLFYTIIWQLFSRALFRCHHWDISFVCCAFSFLLEQRMGLSCKDLLFLSTRIRQYSWWAVRLEFHTKSKLKQRDNIIHH
jgi:hypothetical protein